MSVEELATWLMQPLPVIHLKWGAEHHGEIHQCHICHIILLTGERPGFCCKPHGTHFHNIPTLPPLPPKYDSIITHHDISHQSGILNLIFSMASLESTHPFPLFNGQPSFFTIQGKIYHHI